MEGRVIDAFAEPFNREASIRPQQKAFQRRVVELCSDTTGGSVLCKVIVVGDVSVGKTALVNRYCRNLFERDYKSTIGVDFESEIFSILNRSFTLQIWDTAGQERFKSIASAYYKRARGMPIL
jgi:Ras-related protein Rab-34